MYTKGQKVETDLKLRHKRIGHINLQKLKNMQMKGVVIVLPKFTEKEIMGVREACQFGKKHCHPFLNERNVRKGTVDVVHSDVRGRAETTIFSRCRYNVMFIDDWYSLCTKRVKHSHASINLKTKSKRQPVDMYGAFAQMEEKSTSPTNFSFTPERKHSARVFMLSRTWQQSCQDLNS